MVYGVRFACLMAFYVVVSCAGHLPVPGGADTVNRSFYTTKEELLERLHMVRSGMSEKEVFSAMGREENEFQKLERNQVVTALYGSSNVQFHDGLPDHEDGSVFLQSLYGYRLNYMIIRRKIGFASPIRIRTDESGFDYVVTLVFRDGVLYAPPILSGGLVERSSSKTFFDYLNPGAILNRSVD